MKDLNTQRIIIASVVILVFLTVGIINGFEIPLNN